MIRWLLWGVLLCGSVAHATTYVRDANGRIVAVTQSNGTSTQYTYDALGNRLQVGGPIAAGQLAVFTFIPSHGTAGTAVTIYGQGFSSTLASDSVSFNGTVATVLSATATQLVASVPVGASTGLIGVTVGGLTVDSATPFVIDDTGEPPTISGVSPSVVVEGGTVTVTGTHLDPLPGQTNVQMGGREVALSSASDTQLIFTALDTSSSGYVVVQTPYGQTTSPTSVVVLPSGFSAAGLVSSGYATANGAAVNLNIGAAGQIGAVLFNGTSGQWLSLQASAITTTATSIAYTVYAPGNMVIAQGVISTSSPSIHLPQLTADGTYMATFQPNTAGAQLTVAVLTDATLTNGAPAAQATTVPWQSERLVFTATAGQDLELELTNINVSGGSQNQVGVTVTNAAGTSIANISCSGTYCHIPSLWNLAAGTYSITVTPATGGTMSFNALLQPDVIGPA
ncbi:IPT/TIG domain-containing protein, partial [Rhodanobacter sp. C05]|uniref:IPT/TIG domain-containing protein n=1 Tax=Rhodanobacter sp. C05 TaxID=1945855 RepID=UPI001C2BF8A6